MKKLFLIMFRPDKYIGDGLYKDGVVWKTYALMVLKSIITAIAYFPDRDIMSHVYMSMIIFGLLVIGVHLDITINYIFMKLCGIRNIRYRHLTKTILLTEYFIFIVYSIVLTPLTAILALTPAINAVIGCLMTLLECWLIYLTIHNCYAVSAKKCMIVSGWLLVFGWIFRIVKLFM